MEEGTGRIWDIFQFTPLREGRPYTITYEPVTLSISIHAPA